MTQGNYYNQPIRSLQTMLQTIGRIDGTCGTLIPDGIFGPETMSAVSDFQRNHAIPVTGVVDQGTWDEIVCCYEEALVDLSGPCPLGIAMRRSQVFGKGHESTQITIVQAILTEIGSKWSCVSPPELTGVMDEPTCSAIEHLQMLCGLPVTGEVDKMTWKHLALLYPLAMRADDRK